MENTRKRRGISLSHNSFKPHPQPSIQSTSFVTTRIQYMRYPLAPQSRPLSAPKARINFNYTVNHHPYFQQNPSVYNSSFMGDVGFLAEKEVNHMAENKPRVERCSQVNNQKVETSFLEEASKPDYIPKRYESFQQCKEVLGKRLFGTIKTANSKANCQNTARTNAFKVPEIEEFNTNFTQILMENTPQPKALPSYLPKPLERPLQDSLRININTPVAEEPKGKQAYYQEKFTLNEVPSQAKGIVAQKIEGSIGQKSEVTLSQKKSKVRQKKDPIKLQQMQRRLLQIIKICDQNA